MPEGDSDPSDDGLPEDAEEAIPIRLKAFIAVNGTVAYEYWKKGKPLSPVFDNLTDARKWLRTNATL